MYCQNCGQELAAGVSQCAACGAAVPGHTPSGGHSSINQLLEDTRRAAHELVETTSELTKRFAAKAESATKDPAAAANRAAQRVLKELDDAGHEIERLLKEL